MLPPSAAGVGKGGAAVSTKPLGGAAPSLTKPRRKPGERRKPGAPDFKPAAVSCFVGTAAACTQRMQRPARPSTRAEVSRLLFNACSAAGPPRSACKWCGSTACAHCQCDGYVGCMHDAKTPCTRARYKRRLVCNPCEKHKLNHAKKVYNCTPKQLEKIAAKLQREAAQSNGSGRCVPNSRKPKVRTPAPRLRLNAPASVADRAPGAPFPLAVLEETTCPLNTSG